jgi:signal transduction histidine kinase
VGSSDLRLATNARITSDFVIRLVAWNELGILLLFRTFIVLSHSIWAYLVVLLPAILLVGFVFRLWAKQLEALRNVRFQRQLAERTRIARDLQDVLLQTIEASKMIADDALDPPADPLRMQRTMSRLSDWLGQATKEGQEALDSLRTTVAQESDLTASPLSLCLGNLRRLLHPRKK